MMHGYYSPLGGLGMHSYFGLGGWLIPVGLGLLVVVGLVVWLVVSMNRTHAPAHTATYAPQAPVAPTMPAATPTAADPAEVIVRERFARGEIDQEEYNRLIAALRS